MVLVTLDGERLLADPGFGMSVLRPIPLEDGAEEDHGGWRYRLRSVPVGTGRGWALERWRDGDWELMHTHDELPVRPSTSRSATTSPARSRRSTSATC